MIIIKVRVIMSLLLARASYW